MTRNLKAIFVTGFALLFATAPLLAHHYAGTVYDATKKITLKGTVTKVEWMNPHIQYYVDVKDGNGKVTNWAIEGGPPNTLYRAGWKKDTLKAGETITIENASTARDGSKKLSGGTVRLPDGKRIFSGSANDGLNPQLAK